MAKHSAQYDERVVRRALRSVQPDTTPPPGCEERVRRRLLAAIEAGGSATTPAGKRSVGTWLRRGALSAAAVLVIGLTVWLLIGGGVSAASADFGEMLRRVREARTATYDVIFRAPGQPETKAKVFMTNRGQTRVVWANGKTQVYDHDSRQELMFSPRTKEARLWKAPASLLYDQALAALREAGEADGQFAGNEEVDGRELAVYRVSQQQGTMQVWVDPRENLPTRIEVQTNSAADGHAVLILENFRWNVPLSASLFSLEVPPGYNEFSPGTEASEEALVDCLRRWAEMSNGVFPEELSLLAAARLLRASTPPPIHAGDVTVAPEASEQAQEMYRSALRASAFIEIVSKKGGWRYVGQNVRYGQGAVPVCWWRPPESPTFRVVYGDLEVKDVSPAQVSKWSQSQ